MNFSWLEPVFSWLEMAFRWFDDHAEAVFAGLLVLITYGLWKLNRAQVRLSETVERAYLSVEPLGIRSFKVDMSNAAIGIKNVGRLPARHVKWVVFSDFKSDVSWKKLDEPNEKQARGDNVVAPGSLMRQASRPFLTKKITNARYVYVWGAVFYDDGLGKSRTTRFCHRYPRDMFKAGQIESEYARFHTYGNETLPN